MNHFVSQLQNISSLFYFLQPPSSEACSRVSSSLDMLPSTWIKFSYRTHFRLSFRKNLSEKQEYFHKKELTYHSNSSKNNIDIQERHVTYSKRINRKSELHLIHIFVQGGLQSPICTRIVRQFTRADIPASFDLSNSPNALPKHSSRSLELLLLPEKHQTLEIYPSTIWNRDPKKVSIILSKRKTP